MQGRNRMNTLNALIAFLNFVFVPGVAYGAQLATKPLIPCGGFLRGASCA
jgi:hypothetical protein